MLQKVKILNFIIQKQNKIDIQNKKNQKNQIITKYERTVNDLHKNIS